MFTGALARVATDGHSCRVKTLVVLRDESCHCSRRNTERLARCICSKTCFPGLAAFPGCCERDAEDDAKAVLRAKTEGRRRRSPAEENRGTQGTRNIPGRDTGYSPPSLP